MKRVLITGGPSNEYIDEVMKITNMSSGKIAVQLAEAFTRGGYAVTAILNKSVYYNRYGDCYGNPNLRIVYFETTEDLEKAIKNESEVLNYDIVIHSAAVADYKPEFSFRMEDMAQEITDYIMDNAREINEAFTDADIYKHVFDMLTNPRCKVTDSSKISSNESHLTVKLGLTQKIIYNLRKWFPNAYICGFKLLESVSEKELVDAAKRIIDKSGINLAFANDLANLRNGDSSRLVVTRGGYHDVKVDGAEGIYHLVHIIVSEMY